MRTNPTAQALARSRRQTANYRPPEQIPQRESNAASDEADHVRSRDERDEWHGDRG